MMKTLFSMVLVFVLAGCMTGYRTYVPPVSAIAPVAPMPTASVFPAAPVLPSVGSYGMPTGYAGGYAELPPPEGVAFVNGNGYPRSWTGANLVKLRNTSDDYVVPRMDGMELVLMDQTVSLRFIPPGEEAWFFLPFDEMAPRANCEEHTFEFDGYLRSQLIGLPPGELPPTPAVAHDRQGYCFSPSRRSGQEVEISQLCFAGYC